MAGAQWLPSFNFTAPKLARLRKLIAKVTPRPKPEEINGLIRDVESIIRTWHGFQQGQEHEPSKAKMRKEVVKLNKAAENLRLAINAASPDTLDLLNQGIFTLGKHDMASRRELGYPQLGDSWLEDVLSHQAGYTQLVCRQLLKEQSSRGARGKPFVIVAIRRIAEAFKSHTGEPATTEKSSVFYKLVEISMDHFGQPTGDLSYLIAKALAEK